MRRPLCDPPQSLPRKLISRHKPRSACGAPRGAASVQPRNASCAAYTALCPSLPFKNLMDSWFFNSNINGLQIEAMPERQLDYANKHTPFLP